jgi:phospholipase/carboxylesterase
MMVHGRGADAGDMLSLVEILAQPDLAYLVPEAVSRSWYPHSFLAPIMRNEPFLSSALAMLDRLLGRLGTEGLPPERVVLLGFSQGACLALEYAARHARRYGGIIGLSGGLIGPEGTPRDYAGQLAGTPPLSLAAATSTRISHSSGCTRPPACSRCSAARLRNASIQG